jgi:hypothetical protein
MIAAHVDVEAGRLMIAEKVEDEVFACLRV